MISSCTGRGQSRGFTLLEVLVVIVLMGIIVTFAVTALRGPNATERLDDEARRLQALIQLASEQAILQVSVLGLRLSSDRYEFVTRTETGWQEMTEKPFQPRALAEGLKLSLSRPRKGDPETPQLLLFADGTMTPVTLIVRSDEGVERIVQGNDNGNVTVQAP